MPLYGWGAVPRRRIPPWVRRRVRAAGPMEHPGGGDRMPALRPSGGGEAALNLRRRGSRWPGTMGEPFQGSV